MMLSKLRKDRTGLLTMLLISILATTLAVSLAFLTAKAEADNIFEFKELAPFVSVAISEPNVDPENVPYGKNKKPVLLVNSSNEYASDAVVRVGFIPVSTLIGQEDVITNGKFASVASGPNSGGDSWILGDITLFLSDTWEDNWFFKDGYFYYKKVLKKGESTTQILNGVSLANRPYYQNMKVQVNVLADAIDAKNGAAVKKMFGVNVDSNGNVTK